MSTATRGRKARTPKPPLTEEQRRLAGDHWEWGLKFGRAWQNRYKEAGYHLPNEMIQTAVANGLIDAARTFDPGRGFKFSTFASHKLRGAMLDAMRVHPLTGRQKHRTGFWESSPTFVSLHAPLCAYGDAFARTIDVRHTLADKPGDEPGAREAFEALIRPLRQSARAALRLIYIEGLNQREAGEEIGVSESRCSQIVKEALAYLRAHHDGDAA